MLNVLVIQVAVNGVQVAIAEALATEVLTQFSEQYRQAVLISKADFEVVNALLKAAAEGKAESREAAIQRAKEIAEIAEQRIRAALPGPLDAVKHVVPLTLIRKLRETVMTAARELPRFAFTTAVVWGAGAVLGMALMIKLMK